MATIADRHLNPGNLVYQGQEGASRGEPKLDSQGNPTGAYWAKFKDEASGYAALMNDLQAKATGKSKTGLNASSTIYDFAKIYAPQSENDSAQYAADLSNWLGTRPDSELGELAKDIPSWAQAMARKEGYTGARNFKKENTQPQIAPETTQYQTAPAPVPQNAAPVQPETPAEPTLGGQLKSRLQDLGQTWKDTAEGKINPASTGLQTIGTGLGAASDIINAGLNKIPLVGPALKGIEKIIGKGTQAFLQTEPGQAVAQSIADFSTKHPELSKDIGASLNIATALPILKGFEAVKGAILDASAQGLKGWAENYVKRNWIQAINKTASGRLALSKSPEGIKTLINEQAIPDIVRQGSAVRYSTQEAFEKLGDKISHIEDNELQPLLKSLNTTGVENRVPLESVRKEALKDITGEFKASGNTGKAQSEVNRIIDDYKNSYGDYVTLEDINDMKRGIRSSVNFNSPKIESDVSYRLGQVFQHTIENSGKKLGMGDIFNATNKSMADLIKAQNLLKVLNGKTVSQGLLGKTIKTTAVGAGEALGNATGIPMAGALGAYQAGNIVASKVGGGLAQSILKRSFNPMPNKPAKIGGLLGSAILQKQQQKTFNPSR